MGCDPIPSSPRPALVERALTVAQPFASAIVAGGKNENRSWYPPAWAVGSWLALHASGKRDHPLWPDYAHLWRPPRPLQRSAIVGIARLVSVWAPGEADDDPWIVPGCVLWEFGQRVALAEPIHCNGALGLWRLPPDIAARLGTLIPA